MFDFQPIVQSLLSADPTAPHGNPSAVSRLPYYFSITFLTAVKKYILPFKKKSVFLHFKLKNKIKWQTTAFLGTNPLLASRYGSRGTGS